MKRCPWPLTRMPWISVRGGVIGSDTSPAYMLRTAAPMACAMRMPRPSSPSVPTLKVPRASGGQCWRSMSSLKMKPPAVSTTPRRARRDTVSPKRCACTPTTRPSSTTSRSTRVSVETAAPAPVAAAARCCMSSHPVERFVLARWPRGAGPGDLVERVGVLAAGVDEALGAVRRHGGLGAERRVERDAARHQPVEVAQALLAVAGDLGLVGIRAAGRHHVAVHVVEAVLEAAGRLDRRAAAEVHDALGQRGGPARASGPLGHEHLRPGLGRAEGRRRPGGTETDDDHVGRVVPVCDLRRRRTASRRWARALHPPRGVAETVAVASARRRRPTLRVRAALARHAGTAARAGTARAGVDGDARLPARPGTDHLAPDRSRRRGALRQGRHRGPLPHPARASPNAWSGPPPTSPSPRWSRWSSRRRRPSCSPRRCRGATPPHPVWRDDLPGARRAPSAAGCAPSTRPSARNGAPSASTSARALDHVERRVAAGRHRPGRLPRGARPPDPGGGPGRAGGDRPGRRGPGRLPRRLLPAQHVAAAGRGDRLRRPRRAGRRRPLVGRRRRGVERRLELRRGARAAVLRELRHRPGPGPHPLLPAALRPVS